VRCLLLFFLFLFGLRARADAVLFIEAPINFLGHVSSTGHAALLMNRLCSDDHIHMRWCSPGEVGSVVSRYKGINGYDWLAMPPGAYLFSVDSVDEVPTQSVPLRSIVCARTIGQTIPVASRTILQKMAGFNSSARHIVGR
jgi:hypothetical protein